MKTLLTVLVAIVETPYGDTYEQTIGRKEGEATFTTQEKENAIENLQRKLGRDYMVCDVYVDYAKGLC